MKRAYFKNLSGRPLCCFPRHEAETPYMLHYPYILAGYTCPETACTTLPGNPHHTESSYTREAAPGEDYRGQPHVLYLYKSVFISPL